MKAANWELKGAVALLDGDAANAGHFVDRAHAGLVAAGHEAQTMEGTIAFASAARARGLELDAAWAAPLGNARDFAGRAGARWWLNELERIGAPRATAAVVAPPEWTPADVLKLMTPLAVSYFDSLATAAARLSKELGPRVALRTLNSLSRASVDGVCSEERYWSLAPAGPYSAMPSSLSEWMSGNVSGGFAESVADGWRVTSRGCEVLELLRAETRADLSRRAGLSGDQRWLAETMEDLAARATADGERASSWRAIAAVPAAGASLAVRIVQAGLELFAYRDDCHIGTWSRAGYDGPTLSVLTAIWNGRHGVDEVAKALKDTHLPADVDRCIRTLVERGDAEWKGDTVRLTERGAASRHAIETETDRHYFARWPEDEALETLAERLSTFIGAFAPAAGG